MAERLPITALAGHPRLWVIGTHDGAGESTLARVLTGSTPTVHRWPASTTTPVLLVARSWSWVLLIVKPGGTSLREALRLLPDLLRLIARLAKDSTLPRGVHVPLALLGVYLACPIDLIPDFVPVLG